MARDASDMPPWAARAFARLASARSLDARFAEPGPEVAAAFEAGGSSCMKRAARRVGLIRRDVAVRWLRFARTVRCERRSRAARPQLMRGWPGTIVTTLGSPNVVQAAESGRPARDSIRFRGKVASDRQDGSLQLRARGRCPALRGRKIIGTIFALCRVWAVWSERIAIGKVAVSTCCERSGKTRSRTGRRRWPST
jgi:hypothetical protein